MQCPVCKKEIFNAFGFCPECGQRLEQSAQSSQTGNYWNEMNKADSQRNVQYKKLVNKTTKEKKAQTNKTILTAVFVVVILAVAVFGGMKYHAYSEKMLSDVQSQLIGKTLTAHDTHMEGLGWIMNEYWQLTFIDEKNLDYAYIETTGPRDEDEVPQYKGTYNYTVSRSITGSYKITTNGASYKLNVNENNEVRGITRN